MIRGARLTLGAAAGAMLAAALIPGGVAAADDTVWMPDADYFGGTTTTTGGIVQETGSGAWPGFQGGFQASDYTGQIVEGNESDFAIPTLGYQNDTITVTGGDPFGGPPTNIPDGTQINLSGFGFGQIPNTAVVDPTGGFGSETVTEPGAGLFGLPSFTDTIFTPWGDFTR